MAGQAALAFARGPCLPCPLDRDLFRDPHGLARHDRRLGRRRHGRRHHRHGMDRVAGARGDRRARPSRVVVGAEHDLHDYRPANLDAVRHCAADHAEYPASRRGRCFALEAPRFHRRHCGHGRRKRSRRVPRVVAARQAVAREPAGADAAIAASSPKRSAKVLSRALEVQAGQAARPLPDFESAAPAPADAPWRPRPDDGSCK